MSVPAPTIVEVSRRSFIGNLAMADPNVNAPLNRTGSAPKAGPDNRRAIDEDEEMNAALEKALGKDLEEPDVSFKRQWDAGLQAELDAALADFDEASFNAPSARSGKPAGARNRDERGQEGRPGTRTGKVIGQRGKVLFVELGGKSEGILPVTDFEDGQIPAPGRASRLSSNGSTRRKACRFSA